MTLSFEPNQPRLLMTSWHARPPVAKTRRAVLGIERDRAHRPVVPVRAGVAAKQRRDDDRGRPCEHEADDDLAGLNRCKYRRPPPNAA